METEIQIFKNPQFGEVRVAEVNGEPMFVAKDVAEKLGYNWQPNLVGHVPEEWKGISYINTPGGNQGVITLSEQGVYFFLARSDKPLALPFQKWMAGEILPSIRKHGGYLTPQTVEEALLNPDTLIRLAINLKEERQKRIEAERQLQLQQPAIVFAESVKASTTNITVAELAKQICQNGVKIGEHRMYNWLVENKYLIRHKRWSKSKERYKNTYEPYQQYVEMGLFFINETVVNVGDASFINYTTYITGKGQVYFTNKILNNAITQPANS